jgi:farnesyl-diphosphate farnesyltransferase
MTATPLPPADDAAFCRRMLPAVSRTFALTIRLLPPGLEHPVLVAYLLCRIADTVEDSTRLPAARKAPLLEEFAAALEPGGADADGVREAFATPASDEERLAHRADAVLREYRRLPPPVQDAVRPWVREMCSGMAAFALRQGDAAAGDGTVLADVAELERYCYFVAGTVGQLLTALFILHDGRMDEARRESLRTRATSFGLGLQLTNIIKDVADDRRRGVSYLPRDLYERAGGRAGQAALREVLAPLIARTREHLHDALEYCTRLPRRQYRVRLFCLTALYFAIRTLRLAELQPSLLGSQERKLKISRAAVYRTLAMSYLVAPVNALVRAYFDRLSAARA